MTVDITDPKTLATIMDALRRALNSLDNEIAVVDYDAGNVGSQKQIKLALLRKSRNDITAIYRELAQ